MGVPKAYHFYGSRSREVHFLAQDIARVGSAIVGDYQTIAADRLICSTK